MKTAVIILVAVLTITFFNSCSDHTNSNSTAKKEHIADTGSTKEIINLITTFYSSYIIERAKDEQNEKKIDSFLEKYCTDSFIKRIKAQYREGELDADPIVDAQDFDKEWINTLTVEKIGSDYDYKICYRETYQNILRCITVKVMKENGTWKIDSTS